MSCNRENVTWQSADLTWNRGFYAFYEVGDPGDEDWDFEWDVEYTNDFNWVRTGLPSEQAAHDAWQGANPGGTTIIEWSDVSADECAALDAKAAACKAST